MQKLRNGQLLAVKLDSGADLMAELSKIAEDEHITGGFVTSGIGMLRGARVGYYLGDRYDERTYEGPHELISLQGSIAIADGKPHLHLHAGLANRSHEVVGGHLFQATVHVVCEAMINIFPESKFRRKQSGPLVRVLDLTPESG